MEVALDTLHQGPDDDVGQQRHAGDVEVRRVDVLDGRSKRLTALVARGYHHAVPGGVSVGEEDEAELANHIRVRHLEVVLDVVAVAHKLLEVVLHVRLRRIERRLPELKTHLRGRIAEHVELALLLRLRRELRLLSEALLVLLALLGLLLMWLLMLVLLARLLALLLRRVGIVHLV